MPWLDFLTLFGLTCMLCQCKGIIYLPSSGDKMTLLPGSTGRIKWTFDTMITAGDFRSWSFTSTDGTFTEKSIARINGHSNATIRVSFPVIAVEKPATLVLKNVNRSYDGTYKFQILASTDSSSEVVVFIAEKPNATLNCSNLITLKEGENFACVCKSEGGNPPANVSWFKDGVKITDVGTKEQTLNLLNVGGADKGIYKCVATSYPHENYTDEKSVQVIVHYSPTNTVITFSPDPAVFNQSLNITCASDGFPEPNFIIYHNGTKEKNGNRLVIENVKWNHTGTYKCIANNSLGNDSRSDFLKVAEEPEPTTQSMKLLPTNEPTLSSTAGMKTNPDATTSYIPICTTTCTPICSSITQTTTPTPQTGDGSGKNQEDGSGKTEWYIVVLTLVSGIIIGIILSYIVFRFHHKTRKPRLSNPRPSTSEVDKTYQELDLTKMNKEENYQSLRLNAARNGGVNDDESHYTELKKARELENNYQSLT